ncbi:MAG: type II secretion system protein GspG [Armatimonadetes bacterium]|nr:type II secretion system protein GspG [Armatimonadota bacterium]
MNPLIKRTVASVVFGLLVTTMGLYAGANIGVEVIEQRRQNFTISDMMTIVKTLKQYRESEHALPKSLSDLNQTSNIETTDGWGHPFVYKVRGSNYTLLCCGQDGKLGGEGLDTDISSDNMRLQDHKGTRATFRQYLSYPYFGDMAGRACLGGGLAGLLCFALLRREKRSEVLRGKVTFQLLALLVAATLIATFMTVMHLPMGH